MEAQTATKTNLTHEQIAAKAYQIWEASGRPEGCEVEHWLRAEQELSNGQTAKPTATAAKSTAKPPTPTAQRTTELAKPQTNRPGAPARENARGGTRPSAIAA